MLAENKNPTAYGTDGEYRTQQPVLSLPKGRNSNISLWDTLGGESSISELCGDPLGGESNFSSLLAGRQDFRHFIRRGGFSSLLTNE
ncbi:MAG: hypothetical protein IIB56_00990 [Planctomycetes bacterium]|nr:hypothetical protein [Planctomycetota bacterium]